MEVKCFANDTWIGSTYAPPFDLSWENPPAGTYVLSATAADEFGAASTAPLLEVTVFEATQISVVVAEADGSVSVTFATTMGQTYTI